MKSITPPPTAEFASHITMLRVAITRPRDEPDDAPPARTDTICEYPAAVVT